MGFPVPGCLGRNSPPPWLDRVGRLPVTNQPAVMIFGHRSQWAGLRAHRSSTERPAGTPGNRPPSIGSAV